MVNSICPLFAGKHFHIFTYKYNIIPTTAEPQGFLVMFIAVPPFAVLLSAMTNAAPLFCPSAPPSLSCAPPQIAANSGNALFNSATLSAASIPISDLTFYSEKHSGGEGGYNAGGGASPPFASLQHAKSPAPATPCDAFAAMSVRYCLPEAGSNAILSTPEYAFFTASDSVAATPVTACQRSRPRSSVEGPRVKSTCCTK